MNETNMLTPPALPPASAREIAIDIQHLRVDYGETLAVDDLCLQIPRGEIFGLVGPNGAGKTSTFKVLATLMAPTFGEVRLCGIDSLAKPAAVRDKMAYMPDLAPLPSDLLCWEFLDLFAAAYGLAVTSRRERIDEVLHLVELQESRNARCKALSRGMTQRLVLAKSLLHRPEILILDEPASGMDPVSRASLREILAQVTAAGSTVIISSHILSELGNMCSSIGLMHQGRLVRAGPMQEVIDTMATPSRALQLRFWNDVDRGVQILAAHPLAGEITPGAQPDMLIVSFEGTAEEQTLLLKALLDGGCKLRGFAESESTIEDIFLSLSESTLTPGGAS